MKIDNENFETSLPVNQAIHNTGQNDAIRDQMSRSMSTTSVDITVEDFEDATFQNSCLESQSTRISFNKKSLDKK